ncbi:MAG: bifunctional alpha/beta hydrolase/OsmC family protein [Salegentibacter sp.]|uniref:Putative redox protein n=1 Tax=Salegentibacter flavus TaxID=287099 RepID=A0A1I4YNZ8_9FLAO|nr:MULTISPECIES: bifunctional alpha/beta hydrolase/OsmC family protein [Salegentibacter]MDR9456063.1 bifunctional alpha/beta hydrolase/OsmC family protein [Salegentibacter sp.]SFN39523.1 putative redox protein [Salegentibacter flavus]
MKTNKVKFKNKNGEELMGYLELPHNQDPHNFVLFAHCFTCNKNFFAAKNISRSLASAGYGVLRFDFTGLGESEGDFSDTNFSGNIQDLVAAAEFLKEEHQAPGLLVGHSLGGAAVLYAAKQIASVKAVATVAAPSTIKHVEGLLRSNIDEIEKSGKASVNIGGRPFEVKKQFLDDIREHDLSSYLSDLKRALLILHSPQDRIVGIKNAEELYVAAKHPKSFISLDGASHLMEAEEDAVYAGNTIATWAQKYLQIEEKTLPESQSDVVANLGSTGYTTQMKAGKHHFTADEPVKAGGNDYGPTPYQLVSAGLAACTSMTLHMYARRKKWPLENVETHVSYSREHASDCDNCEDKAAKLDTFKREIQIKGDLDEKQKKRLLEIADKCPVHKSLTSKNQIPTFLKS